VLPVAPEDVARQRGDDGDLDQPDGERHRVRELAGAGDEADGHERTRRACGRSRSMSPSLRTHRAPTMAVWADGTWRVFSRD